MATEMKPIGNEQDHEIALADVAALWGAARGTPEGDRLDLLATMIDVYEAQHHTMDPPYSVKAINFRIDQ
jgi:HTH-type transcriptional regulator / antitoxin HigA